MENEKMSYYKICLVTGIGVMESPFIERETVMVFKGTEDEAYIISRSMSIKAFGIEEYRSSWRDKRYEYKEITVEDVNQEGLDLMFP